MINFLETLQDAGLSPELKKLLQQFPALPDVARKLVIAVANDLGDPNGFTARHRLNTVSKSFPYCNRTIANRDSEGTGPTEKILIGKHMFHRNLSLLEMLCRDLSKQGGGAAR